MSCSGPASAASGTGSTRPRSGFPTQAARCGCGSARTRPPRRSFLSRAGSRAGSRARRTAATGRARVSLAGGREQGRFHPRLLDCQPRVHLRRLRARAASVRHPRLDPGAGQRGFKTAFQAASKRLRRPVPRFAHKTPVSATAKDHNSLDPRPSSPTPRDTAANPSLRARGPLPAGPSVVTPAP